MEEFEVSAT